MMKLPFYSGNCIPGSSDFRKIWCRISSTKTYQFGQMCFSYLEDPGIFLDVCPNVPAIFGLLWFTAISILYV